MTALFWFRRDLRLQDNEALTVAAQHHDSLLPVFVFPAGFNELMPIRQASLIESVRSLANDLPSGITLRSGSPEAELLALCNETDASEVYATRSFDTKGMLEQSAVAAKLFEKSIALKLIGSNYAVEPGTVKKEDGSPLKVYTPFYKRWSLIDHGSPFELDVNSISWESAPGIAMPAPSGMPPIRVRAGEAFALRTLARFEERALDSYHEDRNRCDLSGTSHLSHALAHGEIHPRTILARLGDSKGHEVFRKEIAWREFYADVLANNPHTLEDYFEPRFANMRYDDPVEHTEKLAAWKSGKTGYPIVDAAMRQLTESGWMHNRARMIVASFLVKDLHFEWQIGAEHFEQHLTDFDPASNSHGWQWTAGCGTDASPYYRVFNPVLQGVKFDPNGDYVRKWVPELRHIPDGSLHEPWNLIDAYAHGYPQPIVDHAKERDESLARLEEIKR